MSFTPISPEENTWMRRDTLASLIQTITYAPCTGLNSFGDKTHGPAKTYHARVIEEVHALFDAAGELINASAAIHFYPVATDGSTLTDLGAFPDDALITLPDGSAPRVLSMDPSYDGLGIYLWTDRT